MTNRLANNLISTFVTFLVCVTLFATFSLLEMPSELVSTSNDISERSRIVLGLVVNGDISHDDAKRAWREIDAKFSDYRASIPTSKQRFLTLAYITAGLIVVIVSLSVLLVWRTRREIKEEWLEFLSLFKLQSKPPA